MRIKTTSGAVVDVAVDEILTAAGRIYAARRQTHGGPPKRAFECRWCGTQQMGRAALEKHQRRCLEEHPELGGFTAADLAALQWSPDGAA